MDDRDFQLVARAKRQIRRESSIRSFLIVGLVFTAVLRMIGIELPFMVPLLFMILFISLVINSDLIANYGLVTKKDLVSLIEKHIHNDPESLTRYAGLNDRS